MKNRTLIWWLAAVALTSCGCTAISLERQTGNQAMTGTDIRYRLVLDNLAKMASNYGNLPSFGTATDGLAAVTDSAAFDAKTALIGGKGFAGETLSPSVTRNPDLNWTIDPVHTADQLRALQTAYIWVLTGEPPPPHSSIESLLLQFQIYDDLACLVAQYPGWFCVCREAQVPKHAGYVAHYGHTCVWLTRGGLKGLSEFTLILTDLATIDPTTLIPLATVTVKPKKKNGESGQSDAGQASAIVTQQIPYQVDPGDPKRAKFLKPVIFFGKVPCDTVSLDRKWKGRVWCPGLRGQVTVETPEALEPDYQSLQSGGPNEYSIMRQEHANFERDAIRAQQ